MIIEWVNSKKCFMGVLNNVWEKNMKNLVSYNTSNLVSVEKKNILFLIKKVK